VNPTFLREHRIWVSASVVVLGGGFAGVLAARRIAAATHRKASVVLIAANDAFVERVRFHELAAGAAIPSWPLGPLLKHSQATTVQATARELDVANRKITVQHHDGRSETIAYDVLVYALGSTINLDAVPGASEFAFSVATEQSSRDLAAALRSQADDNQLVVCGGGMTGVELATEIAEAFPRLRVRIVSRDPICEPLAPRARSYLATALASRRIQVDIGKTVREVRARELVFDDGTQPFDLCVWAASFAVSPLARSAGLAVHPNGQLELDATLRSSSHPEVFGAGDAARPTCTVPIRMGCATAMPMAAHAAANVVAQIRGRRLRPFKYAYTARFISIGRRDALAQFTRFDDSPRRLVLTGRLASWLKDLTFRFNVFALKTGFYPWRLTLIGAPRLPAGRVPPDRLLGP
jgi:NADH dehydrogenase